jgi:ABC-type glutathione transport system ATPase component
VDRVIVFDSGRIIADGPKEKVLQAPQQNPNTAAEQSKKK